MPPAFSAEEKDRITRLLLETGSRLFPAKGLRKTSLDELVEPAGIAKSSFYAFFDSKEALYLELMLRQTAEVRQRVVDDGLLRGETTRDGLRRFLRAAVRELATNPLYSRLMTHPEEMDAVRRRVDPARIAAADNPVTALAGFLTARRGADLIDADVRVVIGVLQTVLFVPVHADWLGDDLQSPVLDLLIDIVAAGLTSRKEDLA
ncbi:TetR/AcrR family transcriptional regulator [Saccharopolyspora taberi]|uniref:TetR/AcrR family transcriptional regulator n=1 Tax=Saccharopolyspora taberi TaxID=60895 RepID=A0ABN3VFX4_9PSEU